MASSSKKGQKRKSTELTVGECILCHIECEENKSSTGIEAWTNLKQHAQQWVGLDQFGTVFNDVIWENGPNGIYYHKTCKIQLFSSNRLQLALNRKRKEQMKQEKEAQVQNNSIESTSDPFAVEIRYHRSCWRKYISSYTQTGKDDPMLHLQHVRLSEAREIFFKHVRTVVLEEHEFRTLQSLLQDYIRILSNFGMKSS